MRHLGRFVDSRKPSPYYSRLFVALRCAQGPEPSRAFDPAQARPRVMSKGRGTKWPVCFMFRVSGFKCFGNARLALRARVTVRPFDRLSALSVIEGLTTSFERIACARSETAP